MSFRTKQLVFWASLLIVLVSCLVECGCVPTAGPEQRTSSPLAKEDVGFVCCILIDMSGSYANLMAKEGRAWKVVQKILDRYFRDRISSGTRDMILIGQLSARDKKTMLTEVSPLGFRKQFSTPDSFRDFLISNSDPNGSRLHDGIREALKELSEYPGVAERKTKSALFICSDMDDNQSDESGSEGKKSINYLLGSLSEYAKLDGNVSMLFVEQGRVAYWRSALRSCGFKSGKMDVQGVIVQEPSIPDFSDQ